MIDKHQTILTICETCKRQDWDPARDPETDGEKLLKFSRQLSATAPDVLVRAHPCLMGCDFACNVSVQADGKISYAIGTFEPTPDVAEAILDFAQLHASSDTGQVPYRQWPAAIKGHFRARILPSDT